MGEQGKDLKESEQVIPVLDQKDISTDTEQDEQVYDLLYELENSFLDLRIGREIKKRRPLDELISEFYKSTTAFEKELASERNFPRILSLLNDVVTEADDCFNNWIKFPKQGIFFDKVKSLIRKNIATIERNIDNPLYNYNSQEVNYHCLRAVSFLVKFDDREKLANKEGRELAFDVFGRHTKNLIKGVTKENELYVDRWFPVLSSFMGKNLKKDQQKSINEVLEKFIKDDFSEGRKGYKIINFAQYLFRRPWLVEKGEEFAGKLIGRYGFETAEIEDILKSWKESAPRFNWSKPLLGQDARTLDLAVKQNLERIIDLEKQKPGIAKFLFQHFGIRCFGRYPVDLLVKQYDNFEDQKQYGVILYPKSDHNGAFYGSGILLKDLLEQLPERYNLRAIEAGSKFEIARKLIWLRKKYNPKISFAIIGGHGTESSILFGERLSENNILTLPNLKGRGVRRTSEFFEDNPTIILNSCSTGVDKGIGQQLSEMIKAKVIAPPKNTGTKSIEVVKGKDGKLDFKVKFRDSVTKRFVAGKKEI